MRPDPIQRIDTNFFWDACERGEFVAQKSVATGKLWHPPRPMCPDTHTTEFTEHKLSGKAKLLTWVRQVRPGSFGFKESPIVILVELEEGLRMLSNLEGTDADDIEIGMDLMVDFAKTSGGKAVPIFRKAEA